MAFQPIPNGAQVALRFQQDGQLVENTFETIASNSGDPMSQMDADNIYAIVYAWVDDTLRTYQNVNAVFREIAIRDMSNSNGTTYVYPGSNAGGAINTDPMPNEVTISLKKNIFGGPSRHKGRFFHIGLSRVQVVGNRITDTVAGQLVGAYEVLRTRLQTANYPLMVASLRENNLPRPLGVLFVVTSISLADTVVDRQGRRGPGRGR